MPGRLCHALEGKLHDKGGRHPPPRPLLLERRHPDNPIDLRQLLVGEPRVGIGDLHEASFVPDAEGVVGVEAGAATVTGDGANEHRVDLEWVDLPLPPFTARPRDPIGAFATLEHHPLDAAFTRGRAAACHGIPVGGGKDWREEKRLAIAGRGGKGIARHRRLEHRPAPQRGERFQLPAPLAEGLGAKVDATGLEEIVDEEGDRKLSDIAAGGGLAMEPFRKHVETELTPRPDDEQLSIEDGALGEALRSGDHLGKLRADEFLAARPERRLPAAAHELRPHPIPLPFHLPARHIAEHGRGLVERRGEEERVGAARRGGGGGVEQLAIILCRLQPDGDEALEDLCRLDPCHDGQRPGHERPRHPDAQAPGEELVPHDPLTGIEPAPGRLDHRALPSLVCLGADRIDRSAEAIGKPPPRGGLRIWARHRLRKEDSECLGEITDVGIALLDEPVGDSRRLRRPGP